MQFIKNTSSSKQSITRLTLKIVLLFVSIAFVFFLLNKIDFPSPKKEIEKVIKNENFKIVK